MDYSNSDKHEKKSKRSSKRQVDKEGDVEFPTKRRKNIKREYSPEGTNGPVQNNINYKKQVLPSWLEITDSEDELQKPTEKPNKKKKDSPKKVNTKKKHLEVSSQEKSSFDVDENETKHSPQKKKKKRDEEQDIAIKQSESIDDEIVVPMPPQKSRKGKSAQKVNEELKQIETVEDDQYSELDVNSEENNEPVNDSKLWKSRKEAKGKTSSSALKNLYKVDEEHFSDSDNHTEDTLDSPPFKSSSLKKTKNASSKASTVLQNQTSSADDNNVPEPSRGSPKKSHKKSTKPESSMHAKTNQKVTVDEPPAIASTRPAKKATKDTTIHFSDNSDVDKPSLSSPETSPKERAGEPSEESVEENEVSPDPDDEDDANDDDDDDDDDGDDDDDVEVDPATLPTWRKPKRRTTILNAHALDVGEEYQMKTRREKACKNCNEVMKIKSKVKIRDMGTQTRESALLNIQIRTPRAQPRVRKVKPRSVEERVIVPELRSGDEELIDDIVKPPKLTTDQIKQLRTLEITFKHPPLSQHQIGSIAGTRTLTPLERTEFEKYAILKKGVFGPSEDETIVENWTKFCKRHNWDPNITYPFVNFRFDGAYYLPKAEQRQKFVQFIAHGLPNRSLYSIIMRFRKIYSTYKSARYTCAEDDIIWSTMHPKGDPHNGDKSNKPKQNDNGIEGRRPRVFADIGRKLNRTAYSVWRRYNLLAQKRKVSKKVL